LLGTIQTEERVLRRNTSTLRPLARFIGVRAGGSTKNLQRAVVDFGAEDSFAQASERLLRHHGVLLCTSSVRKITLEHARRIEANQRAIGGQGALPRTGAETIIAEIDGTMLPIVETSKTKDRNARKNRRCHWKETRLSAARVHGQSSARYAVSAGAESVQQAGYDWAQAVAKAGWGLNTWLHIVCDGAPWIYLQYLMLLGERSSFLLDFYHVCDYLAAACATAGTHKRWLEVQKQRLKSGHPQRVLKALKPHIEADCIAEEQAPVRAAYRYIENHINQLEYKSAIEKDLPIGSGLIEAGHRHVLQKRLKISGAWWTEQNIHSMAQLRVCRANQEEDSYWDNLKAAA
jgi:hypothetical protein